MGERRSEATRFRARRKLIRALAIAAGALTAIILVGLPLYVFPPSDSPTNPGVIEVLGPAALPRVAVAQHLDGEFDIPLLISVAPDRRHGLSAPYVPACLDAAVTCTTPRPFTTVGEVQLLTDYSKTHPIESAVVVTFTPQVTRARFLFAKCSTIPVSVIGVKEDLSLAEWAYQYVYQSGAFVKAFFAPCPANG